MLHLIPSKVPQLTELLADLGNPTAEALAGALDVTTRTVWRWRAGSAPLAARLALYWLTPEGWSAHESEARRRLDDWRGLVEAYRRENDALAARCARLAALGSGAANGPLWSPPQPRPGVTATIREASP